MGRLLIFGTNISSESSPWLRSVHSQLACLLPVKIFKSDGQEISTKILISMQELKNRFLSFFVHK